MNTAEHTYLVEGMSCEHCRAAIAEEVSEVRGVESVEVDLDARRVSVHGEALDDGELRAAIAEAGYAVLS